VDRYTMSITSTSPWGTQPRIRVTDLCALDVMSRIDITMIGTPNVTVRDMQGHPMTAAAVVREGWSLATTPEAEAAWTSCMVQALVTVLNDPTHRTDSTVRSDDWRRAGRWWAQTAGTPVSRLVTDRLREHLTTPVSDLDEGLRVLAAAGDTPQRTSRSRGTALGTDYQRASRLRGTAFADDRSQHRETRP
jgi:hypothetical protein